MFVSDQRRKLNSVTSKAKSKLEQVNGLMSLLGEKLSGSTEQEAAQKELNDLLQEVKQTGRFISSVYLRIRLQDTAREVADTYFTINDDGIWPNAVIEECHLQEQIEGLKNGMANEYEEPHHHIPNDFSKLPNSIRKNFVNRGKELKLLSDISQDESCNVFVLVAPGGVGKTTLVRRWLELERDHNYRGFSRVYGFSFSTLDSQEGSGSENVFEKI